MSKHNGARCADLMDAVRFYVAGVAAPVDAAHRALCVSGARTALARLTCEPSPLSALVRAERAAARG